MNKGLRISGFILWILTSIVIFMGGFIPLLFGIGGAAIDIFEFLTRGMDGNPIDPELTWGGLLLGVTVVTIISSFLVFVLSAINLFLTTKPVYTASKIIIISECVILGINAFLQLIGTLWINLSFIPTDRQNWFYIVPIAEFVLLIGLTVHSVFSIRNMKQLVLN